MDHPLTMAAAIERKSQQYDEAVEAIRRAQQALSYSARTVAEVSTIPMVFGVRGAMAYSEACEGFKWFAMSAAKRDRILAKGVREAITGASDLCTARFEALKKVPAAPRLPNGKRQRVVIPQKPFKPSVWRGDRGRTEHSW